MRKQDIDPTFHRRRKIVGVMGSGREPFDHLAAPVGRLVARAGHHLLTGGGGGVMESVSRAFFETVPRDGQVLGVIRALDDGAHPGAADRNRAYRPNSPPNPYVELPIFTHLPLSGRRGMEILSRNHINVLTSDVVVVLPGGGGTLSEFELACRYGWPAILFLGGERLGGRHIEDLLADAPAGVVSAEDPETLAARIRDALTETG